MAKPLPFSRVRVMEGQRFTTLTLTPLNLGLNPWVCQILGHSLVLGHIAHLPPISVGTGPKCFTEDWALIKLHNEKINWNSFKGNVVDLGTVQSISLRSYSLSIISRHQDFRHEIQGDDVP